MNDLPAIDMVATGRNIADLRRRAGMTVADVQAVFGFRTPQAIFKWQRGDALPTIDNLVILSAIFGVTIDAIVIRDRGIA